MPHSATLYAFAPFFTKAKWAILHSFKKNQVDKSNRQSSIALIIIWTGGVLAFVILYFYFFRPYAGAAPASNFKHITPNVLINKRHANYIIDSSTQLHIVRQPTN
jgi:hypothetical protein